VTALAHRVQLLRDEQELENLQRIYGYYLDRAMWDQVADLFAKNGTIEMGLSGVYTGRERVRGSSRTSSARRRVRRKGGSATTSSCSR
jgi:hypothetical protein